MAIKPPALPLRPRCQSPTFPSRAIGADLPFLFRHFAKGTYGVECLGRRMDETYYSAEERLGKGTMGELGQHPCILRNASKQHVPMTATAC